MRDRFVVALAIAAWVGAVTSLPIPRTVGVVAVVAAIAAGRPVLLVVAVAGLACGLGAAARDGLVSVDDHTWSGDVVLVADPVPVRGGVRVDVRADGARYEAIARGRVARDVRQLDAGDVIRVDGRVKPRRGDAPWLDARHVVARLEVERVHGHRRATGALGIANALRDVLARGGDALPPRQRPLYTGMVFGDDREQQPIVVDDLRAAGLGHLLAVSGQNVAVMLGAARPLLERCRYRVRFPLTLGFLALLLLVTRAEPSVLRAATMSGVVALAAAIGREASSLRVLALAVTVLLLVDPLLVESVGFRLSAAASAGIVLLARPIADRLPLPRWLAEVVSVTLAAQLAVAPIVLATFGGMPVASLPANVVAAPVSGPVMVWGVTAGVVAGVVGGPVATAIHLPTRLMLGWVELVGRVSGQLPLGELHGGHVVTMVAAGAVAMCAPARHAAARRLAGVVLVATVVHPAWQLHDFRAHDEAVAHGVRLWRDGTSSVVAIDGRADAVRTLEALRRAGVRRVDVVVLRTGSVAVGDVVRALEARYSVGAVWAPAGHQVRGATTPPVGATARAGPFALSVVAVEPRLDVRIEAG